MDVVCDCEVESKGDISGRSSAVLKTFRNWGGAYPSPALPIVASMTEQSASSANLFSAVFLPSRLVLPSMRHVVKL
jgi:hypothetical protein